MKKDTQKSLSTDRKNIKALDDEDLLNVSGGVLQQNININQMWGDDGVNCPRCGSPETAIDFAAMEHFCLHCGNRWF